MREVSVREARNTLTQLIQDVQAGDEVVITHHGMPVARLVAVLRSTARSLLDVLDSLPPREHRRSESEIEAGIIQTERNSWE